MSNITKNKSTIENESALAHFSQMMVHSDDGVMVNLYTSEVHLNDDEVVFVSRYDNEKHWYVDGYLKNNNVIFSNNWGNRNCMKVVMNDTGVVNKLDKLRVAA